MFRMILFTQWKWSRLVIVLGVLAAFALPLLSIQQAGNPDPSVWEARMLLASVQAWGVLYPVLATVVALLVALAAWSSDHRGRHVYALSLPIPRWHYALQRFGAGLVLLAPTAVALLLGALLAAGAANIPAGLQAYPGALALRFALALVVAYSVFFAITAGTTRTAGIVLAVIGGIIVLQVLAEAAGLEIRLLPVFADHLMLWPGPLEIFSGRWMLIDV
jgi:hypothetical protein